MNKTFHAINLIPKLLPFVLFFLLFSLLSGCGGGTGSSSMPSGLVTPIPEVIVPVASGRLLPVNATTIQTGNKITMAVNPQNNDVYVATLNEDSPSTFYSTVLIMRPNNVTGLLTQTGKVDKVQGLQWLTQIQVDPAGKYIYFYGRTGGGSGAAISVYGIDSGGMLFYKNTVPVGAGNIFYQAFNTITGITLTPDGRYIYLYYPVASPNTSDEFSESVSVYGIDQDAQITLLDSVAVPYLISLNVRSPSMLHTLVASNPYVYIQHTDGSGISTYSNNNGKLTLVNDGTNVNTHNHFSAMALDPSGKFLYAAAVVNNQIKFYVHSIATNGSLEIVNVIDGINSGGTPFDMTIDSSNRYLYLFQSDGIGMYRIDKPGEVLAPLGMQSAYINRAIGVESPGFFAINTSGKYLYTLGLTDTTTNTARLNTYLITQPSSPLVED